MGSTSPYTAMNNLQPVEAPQWLIDWLLSQKTTGKKDATPEIERDEHNKVPHGKIHGFLLREAGKLRGLGLDAEQIEPCLFKIAYDNCALPLDDELIKKMATSICNFPAGAPEMVLTQTPPTIEPEKPPTIPRECLASSYLGRLYDEVFAPNGWTLELALPALVTAASVLIPKPNGIQFSDLKTSLYTALISPVHGGKSQVAEWAAKSLGIFHETRDQHYTQVKFGSAEQMWKFLSKHSDIAKDSKAFRDAVLINPDEWAHVMAKAGIPDASFSTTLTSAFYQRSHTVTLGGQGGGRNVEIPFSFSLIGGIVQDEFDSVFGAAALGGLYDRFLFGLAPEEFHWSYKPFPADHPFLKTKPTPVAPTAHPSLMEVIKAWNDRDRDLGRIVEVCVRVATVFAGIDGRKEVTGEDLEKLWSLALYQKAVRGIYKPNPGVNPDAVYANVALNWIHQHAQQWRTLRDLQKGTNYHRRKLGPNVAFRSVQSLAASGDVDMWVSKLVDKDGTMVENDIPFGYSGKRPRLGGGLVRVARHVE